MYRPCRKFIQKPSHRRVFLGEQVRDSRILSIYKVQIKMSDIPVECTAHDQLEDCPQTNAPAKQNSKQPTAVGLGEQFKMNVIS